MCIINSLAVCSGALNNGQITELILPTLIKCLKDKVPNIRFTTIRMFGIVMKNCDNTTKEKIKGYMKDLTTDEDVDVKQQATKLLSL